MDARGRIPPASLNIKNETVHDVVREAAARTGKSQTSVVEAALRAYLDGLAEQDVRADIARHRRIDAIVVDLQKAVRNAGGLALTTDDLYDENGLPA